MQRSTTSPSGDFGFRGPRFDERLVGRHGDERVEDGIQSFDARQTRVREFHGRNLARVQELGRIRQRERSQIVRFLMRRTALWGRREHAGCVRAKRGGQEVASSWLNHGSIVI